MEIDSLTFDDLYGNESDLRYFPDSDAQILTSDGIRIPVHSSVLVSVSPVFESIIDRPLKHRSSERLIPILGVPRDAVFSFVRFLYTSRCDAEHLERYAIHLLALSHVYMVPQLKRVCKKDLSERLTTEIVIDVLQLARLCDAPDLYLKCLKLVAAHFKAVEATEGWKFLQDNDPWLELEILQFIDESETRKKTTRRRRKAESVYMQLSEAMECLEHICKEGCTNVGPTHADVDIANREPCSRFATCQGLQMSFRHFAACEKRATCSRCKRTMQLLRLHSCICDHSDSCKVPLCRQFKLKMQQDKKMRDDPRWRLLVRKVLSAKTISTLTLSKRKREEEENNTQELRSFRH